MPWSLTLAIEDGAGPLFTRIAHAIAREIERGRLEPGQPLPGTRTLAEQLEVNRNTVVAAYRELVAQGWAEAHPASATVVSPTMPTRPAPGRRRRRTRIATRTGYALSERGRGRDPRVAGVEFNLVGGLPDPRLAPRAMLARALGRVVRRPTSGVLDYADAWGHSGLRRELARMLRDTRGLPIAEDDILVVRGSQMALYAAAAVLCAPGDSVAVEEFGYAPAWRAFEAHGTHLVSVPVDEHGLDPSPLLDGPTPRAVYLTPHHQFPTTACLSADRRITLMRWAAEHRVALIEDDYDNEYHYDGRPVLPLAASDPSGQVVYIGTLSKVVAPGLRIGWVVGPRNLLHRIASLRSVIDGQGGLAIEAAAAELLEEGELQRHIWRTKRLYAARRDALAEALTQQLGSTLTFRVPSGGLALWAEVDPAVDTKQWVDTALRRGVGIGAGHRYHLDAKRCAAVRIGFARHTPEELREAVKRLARALSRIQD